MFKRYTNRLFLLIILLTFSFATLSAQPKKSRKNRKWLVSLSYKYQPIQSDVATHSFFTDNAPAGTPATKKIAKNGSIVFIPLTMYRERWFINMFSIGIEFMDMNLGESNNGFLLGLGRRARLWKDKLYYSATIEYHKPIVDIEGVEYLDLDDNDNYQILENARVKEFSGFVQLGAGLNYEYKFSALLYGIFSVELGYMIFSDLDRWERPTDESYSYADQPYRSYSKYESVDADRVRYKINDFSSFFFNIGTSILLDL